MPRNKPEPRGVTSTVLVAQDVPAAIVENECYGDSDYHRIVLEAPAIARAARPGQFVQLRVAERDGWEPLLRRPFSIMAVDRDAGTLKLLYRVVGRGTALLARVASGTTLDLLGPLGTSFTAPDTRNPDADAPLWCVGGGFGLAPFEFVAREWPVPPSLPPERATRLFAGARTAADLPFLPDLENPALGLRVDVTTEDGSRGFHGLVTALLKRELTARRDSGHPQPRLLACGPMGMLRAVAALAVAYGIECEVSLEERMACGWGVCNGCVCRRHRDPSDPAAGFRYARICVEGPVLPARDVLW